MWCFHHHANAPLRSCSVAAECRMASFRYATLATAPGSLPPEPISVAHVLNYRFPLGSFRRSPNALIGLSAPIVKDCDASHGQIRCLLGPIGGVALRRRRNGVPRGVGRAHGARPHTGQPGPLPPIRHRHCCGQPLWRGRGPARGPRGPRRGGGGVGSLRARGRGPGLAATAISGLAVDWFYLQPRGSLVVVDPNAAAALALFFLTGVIISYVVGRLRKSLLSADSAEPAPRPQEDPAIRRDAR